MTLTAIVGALMALVARPQPEPETDRLIDGQRDLINRLNASHARLIDRIERLERELAMAQQVLEHWRGEAARLARQNRERRGYDMMQAAMAQQMQQSASQALQQTAIFQHAQQFAGLCNCVPSRSQVWAAQNGLVQQLNTFPGD